MASENTEWLVTLENPKKSECQALMRHMDCIYDETYCFVHSMEISSMNILLNFSFSVQQKKTTVVQVQNNMRVKIRQF